MFKLTVQILALASNKFSLASTVAYCPQYNGVTQINPQKFA